MLNIQLSDENLFGNAAAEDELEEVFSSYAVERREVKNFLDPARRIAITRAYKGEGKSALLRLVALRLQRQEDIPIIIHESAAAVSPDVDGNDSDNWVRGWKINLLRRAVREIGAKISSAFTDDEIALLEEAEISGFKGRSFVSSLVDRLKSPVVPIERTRIGVQDPEAILKRWRDKGSNVWFIIDDIDQNFENTPTNKIKIAAFFTAIRQISNLISEFKFRTAVRPNVWAIIKREYEALSHVEQYIDDISWSLDDYYLLLSKRIEGYLRRNNQWDEFKKNYFYSTKDQRTALISKVFIRIMPWGKETSREVTSILYTLSRHRPRWLIELCKESAKFAASRNKQQIDYNDLEGVLDGFSKRRVDDTVAEFRPQCAEIESLLTAFAFQPERFVTSDLMTVINNRILQGTNPKIIGVQGKPSAREVAQFLYQIGFLTARKNISATEYSHVAFSENPRLLSSSTNIDQGFTWEIHPVFRQALKLKNVPEQR